MVVGLTECDIEWKPMVCREGKRNFVKTRNVVDCLRIISYCLLPENPGTIAAAQCKRMSTNVNSVVYFLHRLAKITGHILLDLWPPPGGRGGACSYAAFTFIPPIIRASP